MAGLRPSTDIEMAMAWLGRRINDLEKGSVLERSDRRMLLALGNEILRLQAALAPADAFGEDGLPVHCSITVTENGGGPCDSDHPAAFKTTGWCADPECTKFYGYPRVLGII